jgi:hypothetical protein
VSPAGVTGSVGCDRPTSVTVSPKPAVSAPFSSAVRGTVTRTTPSLPAWRGQDKATRRGQRYPSDSRQLGIGHAAGAVADRKADIGCHDRVPPRTACAYARTGAPGWGKGATSEPSTNFVDGCVQRPGERREFFYIKNRLGGYPSLSRSAPLSVLDFVSGRITYSGAPQSSCGDQPHPTSKSTMAGRSSGTRQSLRCSAG